MLYCASLLALSWARQAHAAANRAAPLEIFVAPPGASQEELIPRGRDGSAAAPFLSVFDARDAMRAGLGRGRPRVVLVEGEHHLQEPLVLDARDTATADAPITWRSLDPNAPARLTGGKQLPSSAFKPAGPVPSGAAGVYVANLFSPELGLNSSVIPGLRSPYPYGDLELFYDGNPMTRARSPNIAQDGTWMWAGYNNVTAVSNMSFQFTDTERAKLWAPAAAKGDLWLHGFFKFDWRDTYIKVDSIISNSSAAGYTVTRDVKTPPQYPFTKGCRFYAVGALELLDAPGEYHVDKDTGLLHFLPPTPLKASSDLVVSVLDTVVVAGAKHHTFDGLTISVARTTTFTTVDTAANVATNNVVVKNCVLSNSGQSCVNLEGSNNSAINNTVFGCGTSGISLVSGDVHALVRGNSSAVGNHIRDCSRIVRRPSPSL